MRISSVKHTLLSSGRVYYSLCISFANRRGYDVNKSNGGKTLKIKSRDTGKIVFQASGLSVK